MSAEVTPLFGGPAWEKEANETCVKILREWLEMAESGEIVGVAMVGLCGDRSARYSVGGTVGGYGMIGALEMVRAELVEIARE